MALRAALANSLSVSLRLRGDSRLLAPPGPPLWPESRLPASRGRFDLSLDEHRMSRSRSRMSRTRFRMSRNRSGMPGTGLDTRSGMAAVCPHEPDTCLSDPGTCLTQPGMCFTEFDTSLDDSGMCLGQSHTRRKEPDSCWRASGTCLSDPDRCPKVSDTRLEKRDRRGGERIGPRNRLITRSRKTPLDQSETGPTGFEWRIANIEFRLHRLALSVPQCLRGIT
jgi:hypothetical protein